MSFLTDREVAAEFGISPYQVQQRCRAGQWPCLRIGRKYMFRPEHIEAIAALCEVKPLVTPADTWGLKTRRRNT